MSDIVERLRAAARHPYMDNTCKVRTYDALEAAAEIEKLRAALKLFQPYSIPKNAADTDDLPVLIGDLRAAAAALKETGE